MARATIDGRNVFHKLGVKTQTVSICTSENQEGVYEDRYSLPITVDVAAAELDAQPDLTALRAWLVLHGGQPLSTAGRPGGGLPPLLEAPAADDEWVDEARTAVERVLDGVVDVFREQPYLHRVEHSLHAWLWSLMTREPVLRSEVPLQDGKNLTQLVHKEWPETHPRRTQEGTLRPRGLFDLAVLSPQQVRQADLQQFTFGRIEAPIVIEVGLDYGRDHLRNDVDKLVNSTVHAPYVLHLSRLTDMGLDETERVLCDTARGVRSAYVHVDPQTNARRCKHVRDGDVSELT